MVGGRCVHRMCICVHGACMLDGHSPDNIILTITDGYYFIFAESSVRQDLLYEGDGRPSAVRALPG